MPRGDYRRTRAPLACIAVGARTAWTSGRCHQAGMSDPHSGASARSTCTGPLEPLFAARRLTMVPREKEEAERLGCLDLTVALSGLGCALLVRTLIIGAALLAAYLALRFAAGSHTVHHNRIGPGGPPRVLHQGVYGWPLVLIDLLYLEKQLGWRVVDELHTRVHFFQEL